MKKLALIATSIVLAAALLTGCDFNQWASKNVGGSYTIKLEQGQKLDMVTWKEGDLWLLTRPMRDGEKAETYKFQEDSTWDVMEGTVTIIETK